MDDKESVVSAGLEQVKTPRKPRAPKAAKKMSKPVTRGQGLAYGSLGVVVGNALVIAVTKWLGIH